MADRFGIVDYGRRLEQVLLAQREVSAILHHAGESGRAREFFVESVLRRVLPPDVVIGSGEIVDRLGGRSKQQDLLLYRNNFPVIDSLAGTHLYLAEGVLATVEVKSNLDEKEMIRATENIASVTALDVSLLGLGEADDVLGGEQGLDAFAPDRIASKLARGGDPISKEDPLLVTAEERIWCYVFAFDSVRVETLVAHAGKHGWSRGDGPHCLCVLGKALGVSTDVPIRIERPATNGEVFLIEETTTPLGWWLGHMLWTLARTYRRPVLRPYF